MVLTPQLFLFEIAFVFFKNLVLEIAQFFSMCVYECGYTKRTYKQMNLLQKLIRNILKIAGLSGTLHWQKIQNVSWFFLLFASNIDFAALFYSIH